MLGDKRLFLHYGDLVDTSSLNRLLEKIEPDEIYNLAAQSHVKVSFDVPDYTAQVDALGTLRFLDAIREVGLGKQTKFYQASTSELFGKAKEIPQSETTPFYPRSPYAVAKLYAYWIIINYREAYNLFACNGILFNHESPRRGETFVTRKITLSAVRIALGLQEKLILGNLNSRRDWGYAPEYCAGMWNILQNNVPDDFVLATGESHSVREFSELAFNELGIELEWCDREGNEKGIIKAIDKEKLELKTKELLNSSKVNQITKYSNLSVATSYLSLGKIIVEVSTSYNRPTEVDFLIGNSEKAKKYLGWEAKIKFRELVKLMVNADFKKLIFNSDHK